MSGSAPVVMIRDLGWSAALYFCCEDSIEDGYIMKWAFADNLSNNCVETAALVEFYQKHAPPDYMAFSEYLLAICYVTAVV